MQYIAVQMITFASLLRWCNICQTHSRNIASTYDGIVLFYFQFALIKTTRLLNPSPLWNARADYDTDTWTRTLAFRRSDAGLTNKKKCLSIAHTLQGRSYFSLLPIRFSQCGYFHSRELRNAPSTCLRYGGEKKRRNCHVEEENKTCGNRKEIEAAASFRGKKIS